MANNPYEGNPLAGRDVLRLLDLTSDEVALVLDTAARQKADWANGVYEAPYPHKSVAIILEKPSMRTRNSFDVGITRLGAHAVVMSDDHSAFSRGETVKDTILVLERFFDAVVIRTFEQSKVEELAEWASIPIVNALTDDFHPCQVLADLLTIQEHIGDLKGISVAYVGDGNNMANTYLEGAALTGMDIRIATPVGYEVDEKIVDECMAVAKETGASIKIGTDPVEAVSGAQVVITDTWTSMGDEEEHDARLAAFDGFQVNAELMSHAAQDAIFMHCLPAHRGEEVTDEVMDGPQSVIYDEAGNRLHAQKALISLVLA
ncbi:MAG: ornithine carbamoyltransferase [Coriobacteriales bacterium]|jgi:ornithine carbamoyltransferase